MSEAADPRYRDLDLWDDRTALAAMWEGQLAAVAAIGPALPDIAAGVAAIADRLARGGRLFYAGAGTSIRIAVQDGTELGPTFDWPEARTGYLIAGGEGALREAVEGAEDDATDAAAQVVGAAIGPPDAVIGIAASGRTPFTVAAVRAARAAGALTVGIAGTAKAPLLEVAEHAICLGTGPEVLAGSTRMKAGTAQKVALNLISTQVMMRLGRVHGGLMVDMRPANAKLRTRANAMVQQLSGVDAAQAEAALQTVGRRVKPAVLVALGLSPADARRALAESDDVLRRALSQVPRREPDN
ncbi:N-acetylmuramic acid 6-phosphate etherase [Pararhodobacter sp. SW119]|uniref:N-acetylmuramic acid 6-phosphate etherase n=1 Tax=Pararhodobacter sp. SW119 TaxID=2780075 RepID=UPI001ADF3B47|nr:N-acetylmuramic acid 6-phosphate etherase [Pararhodobacter sp. SW119]